MLDTGRCSKGVIKKALFDENGKLQYKFNTKEIRDAIIKNYYLDKEDLEKLDFTEEAANELSEKYQAQEEWSIEKYQKDLIIIHNIDTLLDRNILVGKDIMKLLAKMTQHHFGENNQMITHNILRYVYYDENYFIKKLYKAIIDAPKKQKMIEEDKDNMEIIGYVEVGNGTSINEYLKWVNDKLEEYIVGWLSPDKYQEMQELANQYTIEIDIKDKDSFDKACKLISLNTHPDKVGKNEALNNDLITATKIKEGVNEHFNITEKLYAPAVDLIQKANLGIKIGDVSIEVVRATHDPSIGNVVKVVTGMISTTALYMGKSGIMNYTLPIEMGYKIYEEDYVGAASSAVSGVATIFTYSALCGSMPVLSIPLTAGMTVYSRYSMLKNGYNLYNELNEEKIESNQFNIYDESLINSREIELMPGFKEEVYWDL